MSCKFTFSEEELRTIETITYVGASLSILGCCLIIVSYVKFTVLRTFPYKLIVFLSLADLFASIAYFVNLSAGPSEAEKCAGGGGCIFAAVMTQFFDVATFFWTATIAFNLRQVLIENKGRVVENYELYYHLVAWGFPAFFAIIVGVFDGYGFAGNWCWIKEEQQILRLLCYYLPLLLIIGYNTITLILVMRGVRETSNENRVTFRLRLYIIVFIFIRFWSILDRIQNAVDPTPSFALTVLHSIFSPLQGFGNALIYGCNSVVVREYKWYCSGLCGGKGGTVNDEEEIFEQELPPSSLETA